MNKFGDPDFKGLNCIGYQNILFDSATPTGLTVPEGALSALVVLVANSLSVAGNIVAYFREDGINPTFTEGMPMTNLTRYGVLQGNLSTFKIVSADINVQSLRVQYYG